MSTKRETLINLYKKYGLEKEDVFKHQHFPIITRSGIEKIIRMLLFAIKAPKFTSGIQCPYGTKKVVSNKFYY